MKVSIWDRASWSTIRQVKGLTYETLAKECGVYRSIPQKWFAGDINPTLANQLKLAKALGIPLVDILDSVDPVVRSAIRYALNND
ncbi:helix-turn-helix domain-containing protein [Streptomyces sp. NBC_00846]|uniref:helix-turn-helix domain-containing protein n=1 Tax=Streptomyces sp. NBC_00846 TaxID=2975849 RepID=UPI0038694232|nr:helix-turn-helix domain-containing protein [Streptomyces sp. NBC_00846]